MRTLLRVWAWRGWKLAFRITKELSRRPWPGEQTVCSWVNLKNRSVQSDSHRAKSFPVAIAQACDFASARRWGNVEVAEFP